MLLIVEGCAYKSHMSLGINVSKCFVEHMTTKKKGAIIDEMSF
jgi:hypothetical protein